MIKKTKKLGVRLTQEMHDALKDFIPCGQSRVIPLPGVWTWTDLVLFALRQVIEQYTPTALETSAVSSTPISASDNGNPAGAKSGKPRPTRKSAATSRPKVATKASGSKTRRKKVK